MRVRRICAECLIGRAIMEAELATSDENLRFEAIREFLRFLAREFDRDKIPARLGTERDRIIKRVTGNPDNYRDLKLRSNRIARKILEEILREHGDDLDLIDMFRLAAWANTMEFGVLGHDFSLEKLGNPLDELRLFRDDSEKIARRLERGEIGKIVYLLDNCGEAIFDLELIKRLSELGIELIVGAKGRPVMNDITVDEARELGFDRYSKILSAGFSVGFNEEEADEELVREMDSSDLIVSKGMGNYEVLSEREYMDRWRGRLLFVLKAKCPSVAEDLGVPQGTLNIKLVE